MGRQSTLSAVHTEVTTPPPTARSAIANGSRLFLENVDGRSAEARRFRDVLGDLVQHLGGADVATEPQKHLARRAAALATWCERTEMSLANGQDMDVAAYVTAANSLRRLLADLGLQRQPRDIGGNLADLLNGRFDSGSLLAAGGSVAHEALRGRPQSAGGIGGPCMAAPPSAAVRPPEGREMAFAAGSYAAATAANVPPAGEPEAGPEPAPEREPQVGDSYTVEETGALVRFAQVLPDGRERWMIVDRANNIVGHEFSKDAALMFAGRLPAPPKILNDPRSRNHD